MASTRLPNVAPERSWTHTTREGSESFLFIYFGHLFWNSKARLSGGKKQKPLVKSDWLFFRVVDSWRVGVPVEKSSSAGVEEVF